MRNYSESIDPNFEQDCLNEISQLAKIGGWRNFIQSFTSEFHVVIRESRIVDLNGNWFRITGYEKEEGIGKDWVEFLHPEDKLQDGEFRASVLKRKGINDLPVRIMHKDGYTVHLRIDARLEPDDYTLFVIARDVSDARQRELGMEDALMKVTAANQSKNQFLMMMSHELRTPLNPIVAFTDILMHQIEDQEQLEMLGLIKDSAHHLSNLLSEILDISSIETGKMVLYEDRLNLLNLIKSSHKMMLPKAKDKGLLMHLTVDQAEDVKILETCIGDRKRVRQILLNLINNAIKFTEKGVISIHLLKPVIEDSMVDITLHVKDTGIGIPDEHRDKIFDLFHQVDMHTTRVHGGQGLGLALSRKLARLMNGDITVDSIPGEGSCFILKLRLALAQ